MSVKGIVRKVWRTLFRRHPERKSARNILAILQREEATQMTQFGWRILCGNCRGSMYFAIGYNSVLGAAINVGKDYILVSRLDGPDKISFSVCLFGEEEVAVRDCLAALREASLSPKLR